MTAQFQIHTFAEVSDGVAITRGQPQQLPIQFQRTFMIDRISHSRLSGKNKWKELPVRVGALAPLRSN
jgi:hypothetical protein